MRYVSPRDVILVLIGAGSMYFASLFTLTSSPEPAPPTLILNSQYPPSDAFDQLPDPVQDIARPGAAKHHHHPDLDAPLPDPPHAPAPPPLSKPKPASPPVPIPETTLVQHAPGWTIFENVYMSNGTILVVTDHPDDYPATEYITSTGLYAWNTPESIQERLPTPQEIDFISPAQARERWGDGARGEDVRVFPVVGDTLLFNDPDQFLNHYYHFCAELFFGAWAIWTGTYTADTPSTFTRAIFPHTGRSWRDNPHMNAFFLRGAFPSITVETEEDWADRADATRPLSSGTGTGDGRARAYHFDRMLLVDRSASFRGPECGSRTQRTASEAMRAVVPKNADGTSQREFLPRGWWEPVRRRVLSFAGVPSSTLDLFNAARPDEVPSKDRTVLTYISRQAVRRRLVPEDHERLVDALEALCRRRGWEFVLMQAERLSREEQLVIAARTTYLVGVHGNGLSHLIMMPPTPAASVFEIFFPEGYAHDYEWTARSLGMRHFAIWNDTSKTFPEVTWPNYPEGFQGTSIPVWGPYVAQLIEDRADGKV